MKRSASMLAGLCRVKNELPDDPEALEEMIQDLRGSRVSRFCHKHIPGMIYIWVLALEQIFREDLQLELSVENLLPGFPGSPAPTLPATDSQLLVAGRPTAGASSVAQDTWLSSSGFVFRFVDLMNLGCS